MAHIAQQLGGGLGHAGQGTGCGRPAGTAHGGRGNGGSVSPPVYLARVPATTAPNAATRADDANLGERLASRNGLTPVKLLAVLVSGSVSKKVRFRTLPVRRARNRTSLVTQRTHESQFLPQLLRCTQ